MTDTGDCPVIIRVALCQFSPCLDFFYFTLVHEYALLDGIVPREVHITFGQRCLQFLQKLNNGCELGTLKLGFLQFGVYALLAFSCDECRSWILLGPALFWWNGRIILPLRLGWSKTFFYSMVMILMFVDCRDSANSVSLAYAMLLRAATIETRRDKNLIEPLLFHRSRHRCFPCQKLFPGHLLRLSECLSWPPYQGTTWLNVELYPRPW